MKRGRWSVLGLYIAGMLMVAALPGARAQGAGEVAKGGAPGGGAGESRVAERLQRLYGEQRGAKGALAEARTLTDPEESGLAMLRVAMELIEDGEVAEGQLVAKASAALGCSMAARYLSDLFDGKVSQRVPRDAVASQAWRQILALQGPPAMRILYGGDLRRGRYGAVDPVEVWAWQFFGRASFAPADPGAGPAPAFAELSPDERYAAEARAAHLAERAEAFNAEFPPQALGEVEARALAERVRALESAQARLRRRVEIEARALARAQEPASGDPEKLTEDQREVLRALEAGPLRRSGPDGRALAREIMPIMRRNMELMAEQDRTSVAADWAVDQEGMLESVRDVGLRERRRKTLEEILAACRAVEIALGSYGREVTASAAKLTLQEKDMTRDRLLEAFFRGAQLRLLETRARRWSECYEAVLELFDRATTVADPERLFAVEWPQVQRRFAAVEEACEAVDVARAKKAAFGEKAKAAAPAVARSGPSADASAPATAERVGQAAVAPRKVETPPAAVPSSRPAAAAAPSRSGVQAAAASAPPSSAGQAAVTPPAQVGGPAAQAVRPLSAVQQPEFLDALNLVSWDLEVLKLPVERLREVLEQEKSRVERGYTDSLLRVARILVEREMGEGRTWQEGVRLAERAVALGDPRGATYLGWVHYAGMTGLKDIPEAQSWFRIAALLGGKSEQQRYAEALTHGKFGVQDPAAGDAWWYFSALGDATSRDSLKRIRRERSEEEWERHEEGARNVAREVAALKQYVLRRSVGQLTAEHERAALVALRAEHARFKATLGLGAIATPSALPREPRVDVAQAAAAAAATPQPAPAAARPPASVSNDTVRPANAATAPGSEGRLLSIIEAEAARATDPDERTYYRVMLPILAKVLARSDEMNRILDEVMPRFNSRRIGAVMRDPATREQLRRDLAQALAAARASVEAHRTMQAELEAALDRETFAKPGAAEFYKVRSFTVYLVDRLLEDERNMLAVLEAGVALVERTAAAASPAEAAVAGWPEVKRKLDAGAEAVRRRPSLEEEKAAYYQRLNAASRVWEGRQARARADSPAKTPEARPAASGSKATVQAPPTSGPGVNRSEEVEAARPIDPDERTYLQVLRPILAKVRAVSDALDRERDNLDPQLSEERLRTLMLDPATRTQLRRDVARTLAAARALAKAHREMQGELEAALARERFEKPGAVEYYKVKSFGHYLVKHFEAEDAEMVEILETIAAVIERAAATKSPAEAVVTGWGEVTRVSQAHEAAEKARPTLAEAKVEYTRRLAAAERSWAERRQREAARAASSSPAGASTPDEGLTPERQAALRPFEQRLAEAGSEDERAEVRGALAVARGFYGLLSTRDRALTAARPAIQSGLAEAPARAALREACLAVLKATAAVEQARKILPDEMAAARAKQPKSGAEAAGLFVDEFVRDATRAELGGLDVRLREEFTRALELCRRAEEARALSAALQIEWSELQKRLLGLRVQLILVERPELIRR